MNVAEKVSKISGKPFKSRRKVNTIREIVTHPVTGHFAFAFEEDESVVEARMCRLATATELTLNERHFN